MKEINCIGDFCPIPILKIKKALETCQIGDTLSVIADHDCVLESIEEYLDRNHFGFRLEPQEDGIFIITITKNH